MADRLRGNESSSRQYLIEALRITTRRKELGNITTGLPAAALLFADRGDGERAVEIYELACGDPFKAHSQWFEDVAGKHIASIADGLPPEVAEAACRRGRERDPWETVKEILAELEAEESQE